jgi:hypothetical protein
LDAAELTGPWLLLSSSLILFRYCLNVNFASKLCFEMTLLRQRFLAPALLMACGPLAGGQSALPPTTGPLLSVQSLTLPGASFPTIDAQPPADASQLLLHFKDSDIKFNLRDMMEILRDHKHEGWVLAAYPDPNTSRPLIGAGFSLDVQEMPHPQRDPLNPHVFVEPSAVQLWKAAGLPPEQLQRILEQYDRNMAAWTRKTYHRKIVRQKLTPQLTEEEATALLRISAIQAVWNAKAYCREFDHLSASQQMALSQLVFQMGTNLEQFVSFLGVLNDPYGLRALPRLDGYMESPSQHWQTVQASLMDSQWARRYSVRAAAVIAMFDPKYSEAPSLAEQRVVDVLRPAVVVRSKSRATATLHAASYSKRSGRGKGKKSRSVQARKKLT